MKLESYLKDIIKNPKSFFLENKSTGQTVFKNAFWLGVAEAGVSLLKFILIVFAARILGVEGYGKFAFSLSFVSMFMIFPDLGITDIMMREMAHDGGKTKKFFAALSLKLILCVITFLMISVGMFFVSKDWQIRTSIFILSFYILVASFSAILYAFFRAKQKMEYDAMIRVFEASLVLLFGFFVLSKYGSSVALSLAYLAAAVGAMFFAIFLLARKFFRIKFLFDKSLWKELIVLSWPLGVGAFFMNIYNSFDSTFMGFLSQISEVGWYNAAYKIIGFAIIPSSLICQSFYPALVIALKESKQAFSKIWDAELRVVILLALPLVIGGIILAPRIIDFAYDESFSPSILAFQILMLMAGVFFLCNCFNGVFVIFNQQKKFLWIKFWGAVSNVLLNIILIPAISLYGAAAARVSCQIVILILFIYTSFKAIPLKLFNWRFFYAAIKALICSVPMYFALKAPFFSGFHVVFSFFIGALVYFLSLLVYTILEKNFFSKMSL